MRINMWTCEHCDNDFLYPAQVSNLKYLRVVIGKHNLMERDLHEHSFQVDDIVVHPEYRKCKKDSFYSEIRVLKICNFILQLDCTATTLELSK